MLVKLERLIKKTPRFVTVGLI